MYRTRFSTKGTKDIKLNFFYLLLMVHFQHKKVKKINSRSNPSKSSKLRFNQYNTPNIRNPNGFYLALASGLKST